MKHAQKLVRLQARRDLFDSTLASRTGFKRPGSFNKTGGTKARRGLSPPKQRSRTAVNAR